MTKRRRDMAHPMYESEQWTWGGIAEFIFGGIVFVSFLVMVVLIAGFGGAAQ